MLLDFVSFSLYLNFPIYFEEKKKHYGFLFVVLLAKVPLFIESLLVVIQQMFTRTPSVRSWAQNMHQFLQMN